MALSRKMIFIKILSPVIYAGVLGVWTFILLLLITLPSSVRKMLPYDLTQDEFIMMYGTAGFILFLVYANRLIKRIEPHSLSSVKDHFLQSSLCYIIFAWAVVGRFESNLTNQGKGILVLIGLMSLIAITTNILYLRSQKI